jgi:hypothetical protein
MVGGKMKKSTLYAVFNNSRIIKQSFDKQVIANYLNSLSDDDLKLVQARKRYHGSAMWILVGEDDLRD